MSISQREQIVCWETHEVMSRVSESIKTYKFKRLKVKNVSSK